MTHNETKIWLDQNDGNIVTLSASDPVSVVRTQLSQLPRLGLAYDINLYHEFSSEPFRSYKYQSKSQIYSHLMNNNVDHIDVIINKSKFV